MKWEGVKEGLTEKVTAEKSPEGGEQTGSIWGKSVPGGEATEGKGLGGGHKAGVTEGEPGGGRHGWNREEGEESSRERGQIESKEDLTRNKTEI